MNEDQEIRAKALEMKTVFIARIYASCVQSGRPFAADLWNDGDLDEFVKYIKTGIKPVKKPSG